MQKDLQVTSLPHSRRREGVLTNPPVLGRGETWPLGPRLLPSLEPLSLVLNLWLPFAESIFGKLRVPGGVS